MKTNNAPTVVQTTENQEVYGPVTLPNRRAPRISRQQQTQQQEKSFEKLMAQRPVYEELERRFGSVLAQWIFDRM